MDKNVKLDHIKMCDMFQPVDESVLAEVVVDVNSDTVTLTDTVTLSVLYPLGTVSVKAPCYTTFTSAI